MEVQYQVRHSSFRSSKYDNKYINPKTISLVLGKSYKLSSETINVYNNLVLDLITYLFTNASTNVITIDDIKSVCLSSVNRPFSLDFIPFTNREYYEEMKDDSYKDSYNINTLQRNNLFRFLLSKQGKVMETDVIRSEVEKLSSATNKKLRNDQALEYLRCLLQVFASYIIMLIYKKFVESDATVIKVEDFFKLLLEDESLKAFVEKCDTRKNYDKRESSTFTSKRNTLQISDLISKSEISDPIESISESEKRMAHIDLLENRKTMVKPIINEEDSEESLNKLRKQASDASTLNGEKRKTPVKRLEARVEVPRLPGIGNGFTDKERKNLQSLLDFLDSDPETVLGPKKAANLEPQRVAPKDTKEGLVRKSFKVFTNIKANTVIKKQDKIKNLEDVKKENDTVNSDDSFEDRFLKREPPKPVERIKVDHKATEIKDTKVKQQFTAANLEDEYELEKDRYYPMAKGVSSTSFTRKNSTDPSSKNSAELNSNGSTIRQNKNQIVELDIKVPEFDPSQAVPDFLRNSRSNRASVNLDRTSPIYIPISPRLTAFDEKRRQDTLENREKDDPFSRRIQSAKLEEEDDDSNIRDSVATIPNAQGKGGSRVNSGAKEDERVSSRVISGAKEELERSGNRTISGAKEEHTERSEHIEELKTTRTPSNNEQVLSRQHSYALDVERVESNSRAIEILLEQNTRLHLELEESKRQVAQLQQTKIKYDYVVTKAYKKVKEIMAENQELRTELGKTQYELIQLTGKLETIQSVFGGNAISPTPNTNMSSKPLATAATQLRLKERLNTSGSDRSLHQLSRDG